MEVQDKEELKQLRDRLAVTQTMVWDKVDAAERAAIFAYGDHYKTFLDRAKTEREAVTEIERQAKALGFVDLSRHEAGLRGLYNYKNKVIVPPALDRQNDDLVFIVIKAPRPGLFAG